MSIIIYLLSYILIIDFIYFGIQTQDLTKKKNYNSKTIKE